MAGVSSMKASDTAGDRVERLSEQLNASEARVRSLIERSPDAFVIVDEGGMVAFVNPAAATLFGVDGADMVGRPFGLPVTAGETTDVDVVTRREHLVAEMRVVETEWEGRRAHVAVLRDITARSRDERTLRESATRLELAIRVARLSLWDIDLRSMRVFGNEALLANLGYSPAEVAPERAAWERLVHPDDLPLVAQAFEDHLRGKTSTFRVELRMRTQSGEWRWVLSQGEVVEWDDEDAPLRMIGVTEDISERKDVEERIRQVSLHDPLTGLPNRALLYEFAEHLLSSARRDGDRAAVLFVDLDRFKPINDTYGHTVGDAVLKEVGKRLTECVRGGDLAGRLGGDEFLAMLAHLHDAEDAARAARHMLESLGQPYLVAGLDITVTPSIGISLFPQDGDNVGDLIKNADAAMYHAKESRRNDFQFFRQEFNIRAREALRIESRLRKGFALHEFELVYQPVIDTETAAVMSAEALLRWPAMNATPERFIPVAEKAGFMWTLGHWVVQEACRQQREWRDSGLPSFPVAVNVSPVQFRQKHFALSVHAALDQARLDAHDLRMEVTESTVMRDADEAADVLHELQHMGVKVALDDFGTGYSSLSYLSRLPIDILKLDQSFVKGIGRNGASTAIAEGIIALGRSLGLEVIAEGVETEEAMSFLRAQHCPRGQGFLICKPMPPAEFQQWCSQHLRAA